MVNEALQSLVAEKLLVIRRDVLAINIDRRVPEGIIGQNCVRQPESG